MFHWAWSPFFLQTYNICKSSGTSISLTDPLSGPYDIKRKLSSYCSVACRRAKDYFTEEQRRQTVSAPASPQGLSLLLINLRVRKPTQSQTPWPPPPTTAPLQQRGHFKPGLWGKTAQSITHICKSQKHTPVDQNVWSVLWLLKSLVLRQIFQRAEINTF